MRYKRGTNPKSLANLAKGRQKGKGKAKRSNAVDENNTWKAIFDAISTLPISAADWATIREKVSPVLSPDWLKDHGITHHAKFLRALKIWGDPAQTRELLQRSEPQDTTIRLNLDTIDIVIHDDTTAD